MIDIMFMSLFDKLRHLNPAERQFDAGAHLFHQGDQVSVLHLVVDGEAHLVRYQIGGAALVLQRAGPGTVLAEASLFADRYHCDSVAVMPTCTLTVPKSAVRKRLAEDPDFAETWTAPPRARGSGDPPARGDSFVEDCGRTA